MRILLTALLCVWPLGAAEIGESDIVRWIESVGGAAERDDQGRVVGVDLASAWISDDDLELIARLENVERIDLSYTWISDRGMERLEPLRNVRELSLYYCDYITDGGVIPLKGWSKLESLNLEGADVTSRSFEHIANLESLRVLHVGHSRVEDEGFENLAPLVELEEIGFGGNKMSGRALPLLKMLPSLRRVTIGGLQRTDSGLWGVDLTDFNLDRIAELTELEELDLHDSKIRDRGLERLSGLTKLRKLDLSGTLVGATGAPQLAKLRNLESLRLWRCKQVGDETAATLARLPRLETLDLAGSALTDDGLETLAAIATLRYLYVADTGVTQEAVERFRRLNPRIHVSWSEPAWEVESYRNVAP